MANTFDLISKYVALLDEVYKRGSLTNDLLGANQAIVKEGMNAKTILIPKVTTQALANYSRNTGFVPGDATLTWQTHEFEIDRGRSFMVDNADDMETAGLAFGTLAADFVSVGVVPEIDAYRFAKMTAGAANNVTGTPTKSTIDGLIDAAVEKLDDANVPVEGRILYVSNETYKFIKQSDNFVRNLVQGENINKNFETYDGMKVVKVPKTRFYSAITLTASGAGGYANDGTEINFMIVHPSAVVPAVKINQPRVFDKAENQTADAYKFDMRIYHDLFVLDNKIDGIYVHRKA